MALTDSVDLHSFPLTGQSLIEASAGTGKTFTIAHLYLRCLLESGYGVRQLLVVTFTNAATQELKGRIRELVAKASASLAGDGLADEALEQIIADYRFDSQARLRLQQALVDFDEASIYSIHGFCQRLLTMFPVEMQTLLQQQVITDERELQGSMIRDYWRRLVNRAGVEEARWLVSAYTSPDGLFNALQPLLAYLAAGHQLHRPDLAEVNAGLQTLWRDTRMAWQQSAEKLTRFLLGSQALKRNIYREASVDALIDELNSIIALEIPCGLPQKWHLLTESKLRDSLKKDADDELIDHPFFGLAETFMCEHEAWLRLRHKELLIDAATRVARDVDGLKSASQSVSFNDLVAQVSRALDSADSGLARKVNGLFPVAMVDEFQDTDRQQYAIFSNLYRESENLILIGDPKQAIYSFRGADVFTYQQARDQVTRHFTLDTNYRSTPDYVDMINRLFSENPDAFIHDDFIRFAPGKAGTSLTLREKRAGAMPLVCWLHPHTDKPVSKAAATMYFVNRCAQEIHVLLQNPELMLDEQAVKAGDLAVLVRTGRQATLIKQALAELGISSALTSQESVFATEQALDICQLLTALIEPSDTRQLFGLLSTDLFGYSASEIYGLQYNNRALVDLIRQMQQYRQHWSDQGLLSMFFRLLREQQTVQRNMRQFEGERRLTNWLHIMEILQQQSRAHASHSQVLQWLVAQCEKSADRITSEEHQLRLDSDDELVRIVTIHKSKGLQYPIVFLPFAWDVAGANRKPECFSYHDENGDMQISIKDEAHLQRWREEQLAEDVRLFYVAMTRARYRCYIGWGRVNGAGSSALAHCLYAGRINRDKYPYQLDIEHAGDLRLPFLAMNRERQRVDLCEEELAPALPGAALRGQPLERRAQALQFTRRVVQHWRISSYSQMVSAGRADESHRPDYDAITSTAPSAEEQPGPGRMDRFSFHKGARAGNFLHDLLEVQPFDRPVELQLIEAKCREYGFDDRWAAMIGEWIDDVLHSDLDGFCLADIARDRKLTEMEFYMRSDNLNADGLNRLLQAHDYVRSGHLFSFATVRGFMKGFIDLVFEHDGRYYVADYKSNYLGAERSGYDRANCEQAIFEHHYQLQFLIYTLALHRYLARRIDDYAYASHFGGVYYLFLRGMSAADDQHRGIYFHRPQENLILALDRLLGA